MIWVTEEGYEFCAVVACYGRLIDSCSEEWRAVCEARCFLRIPLEDRLRQMELTANKRGDGKEGAAAVLAELQTQVKREWQWRKDRKAAAAT